MNHHPHHPYSHPHIIHIPHTHPHPHNNHIHNLRQHHISSSIIPQFNLSQLPQIPVIIPTNSQPMLPQSTTNNAFNFTSNDIDQYDCIPSISTLHVPNLNNYPRSHVTANTLQPPKPPLPSQKHSVIATHRQPPKPPSPTQKQKINSPSKSDASSTSTKSRKRSLSEMKNTDKQNGEGSVAKKRKLSTVCTGRQATNRVWRQTRQNAKFRMAIELLDTFRSDHGGKLPSLRAIMKMLKVGFPKAHEILDEYARHVGCSKDKLVQDMTIRQEKKNKTDLDGSRKKRINRNIFEYPINVNGKLQEIILNLLHQKKVCNMAGMHEMYLKMERSMIEFESFYEKFGLNDKLRLGQSYFMLAAWYFYDKGDIEGSYLFIEKALSTFRDCNYLAINAGFTVTTVQQMAAEHEHEHKNEHICMQDVGFFWPQIFEIYILGGHVLLSSKQYYDAKTLYLFAYELVKYVVGSQAMNACVALEALSHVCGLENNINECCSYIEQIIKILRVDMEKNTNKGIDIEISGRGEEEEDHNLKLLNIRCYYSCILSLDYYENKNEFNMNKALEIYREVVSECMDKFGTSHDILFGVYLYFAFHFINIEKFEYAFECIEFIKNENLNGKVLDFEELNGFQSLLNGFILKLLRSQQQIAMHCSNKLKENCLKIFEYQLLNCDDINHYILNHKQEIIEQEKKKKAKNNIPIKKEIKKEKNSNIKQEEEEEEEEEIIIKYMDKNEIIFEYQINLLLYKFNDFERVKQFIDNFENNEIALDRSQIEQFRKIKKDFQLLKDNIHLNDNNSKHSIISYQNHNHNMHHNMQYDFNVLPNFLPMTATKSMS